MSAERIMMPTYDEVKQAYIKVFAGNMLKRDVYIVRAAINIEKWQHTGDYSYVDKAWEIMNNRREAHLDDKRRKAIRALTR